MGANYCNFAVRKDKGGNRDIRQRGEKRKQRKNF